MGRVVFGFVVIFTLILFTGCVSSGPILPSSPTQFINGFFSNAVSAMLKWVWSFKPIITKPVISGRPMMKFESGYNVETVFDGSKFGIEPFSIEALPNGELLILDSANSNVYKISASLSLYSRPKLVAGSPEGYFGHVDGKHRESKMNHPKGIAVDDRGNIYVADTMNMAIRKISDTGVTTIAGGKSRGSTHSDGPSEDAKFSNDFDVVYIGSSCSLLVIDRGNRALREIQLHFDDCAYQYESGFPLGVAVLFAAGFFGYMLALLQRRVSTMVSSHEELKNAEYTNLSTQYNQSLKSVRPPLIPTGDELEKQEGLLDSLGKLCLNAFTSIAQILSGIFPGCIKKSTEVYQYPNYPSQYLHKKPAPWPSQDSYEIPHDDEPPSIDSRTPTPRKTYPFMTEDASRVQSKLRKNLAKYSGEAYVPQSGDKSQQGHKRNYSTPPQALHEKTDMVFGKDYGVGSDYGRFNAQSRSARYSNGY